MASGTAGSGQQPPDGERQSFRRLVRDRRAEREPIVGTDRAYRELIAQALAGDLGDPEQALGWVHEDFHLADKEAVFASVRAKGPKIDAAGVVAASRLYTPPYIVAFLLQNTLGVLWLEMHPRCPPPARWSFLVRDAARGERAARPLRELRVLDPCCGCGAFLLAAHDMLTELYAMERGLAAQGRIPAGWTVSEAETSATIVRRNLYGADLDAQAVDLVALALRRRAGPAQAANLVAPDPPLGSLDRDALWPDLRFDVVVTNPPYVGFRRLDPAVKSVVTAADPRARSDLAIAFQSRCLGMLADGGLCGTVTPAAWLTSRDALGLRTAILDSGGPRVTAALGQRVFDEAPLLFVALSVVARGSRRDRFRLLRPAVGSGAGGLAAAIAEGGEVVARADVERLPLKPFLPAAPPAVLATAGRGPRIGDLFAAFDGVWTGDNARDTRYWWELPHGSDAWRPLSGGQGYEPWSGPVRRRIRSLHVAGQPARTGAIEYARVAGGRLAARLVHDGAAALAGIVTFVPRNDEAAGRIEEVLAIFNSRIGTAWLRTLTSGLNFNPGYAAEIPLGREAPPNELRQVVRRVVALRARLVGRDPTADAFVDTRPPWNPCEIAPRIRALEARLDDLLARHLGIASDVYARLAPPTRPRRRGDDLDDHLMVRLLRLLGFRWPAEAAVRDPSAAVMGVREAARRLGDVLASEGAPDLGVDLETWILRRLPGYQESRFRRRPVLNVSGGAVMLVRRTG